MSAVPDNCGDGAKTQERHERAKRRVQDCHLERSTERFFHRRIIALGFISFAPKTLDDANALQSFFCHNRRIGELVLDARADFLNATAKHKRDEHNDGH